METIKRESSIVLHTSSTLNNTEKVIFTKNVGSGKIDRSWLKIVIFSAGFLYAF